MIDQSNAMTKIAFEERAHILQKCRSPHGQLIGLRLLRSGPGDALTTLPYHPVFVGDTASGVIHGGLVTTLLDETCGLAVQLALDAISPIATLDLRIDYMRPATPDRALFAHATCYHVTRSIAFVRATAYQETENDPVASAAATFMIGANRSDMYQHESRIHDAALPPLALAPSRPGPFGSSPYTQFLGVKIGVDGYAMMPYAEKLVGNPLLPALHGGTIGAFLETTAIFGVAREIGENARPKPIGLTINYLRSGQPEDTYADVSIVKQGRRVVAFQAQAWQKDKAKPIASAFGHFKLRREQAADKTKAAL